MIWSKSLPIRKMLILSGWTELQQWRNCLIHRGGVCKLECLLSKSDVFLCAEKMWRLPLPDVSCAPELFWLLPCGDCSAGWCLSTNWGEVGPSHTQGRDFPKKSHLWFQGADLSARTERREAPQRWGSSSGKFGFHRGDNLLFKYIWKKKKELFAPTPLLLSNP